jgi:PKD domain.
VNAKVSGGIPPYQYIWSNGRSNSAVMQTDENGLIMLTATDSRGCSANYTLNSDVPTLGIRHKLLNCNDRLYQFSTVVVDEATGNYTYRWDFGDGHLSSDKNIQHKYAKAGSYKVTLAVTGKSCTSTYTESITVEPTPTLSISPEPTFCKGDSITIVARGANTYKWNDGTTADFLTIKQEGNYSFKGTTTAGCYDSLTFTTSYYPMYSYPILSDKNEISIKEPTVNLWSDNHPALHYLWNFGDNSTAESINQTHTYNIRGGGYYDVVLTTTDMNNCKSSSFKRVWIINNNELNTFTPNGDGLNDIFLKGWHVKIYNRNGVLITDSTNGWDGTYHGKQVAPDTYFYVIYYMSESGTKTKEGYVTLVR